jgi:hypothetical protein
VSGRGWLAFLWTVIGAVVGHLLGQALGIELLTRSIPMGLKPVTLDLNVIAVTFGLDLNLSVAGAIGLVLALWLSLRHG